MAKAKRDYKKESRDFHGTAKQIANRSQCNKARKLCGLQVGDRREVDHIKPVSRGGTNHRSNLRVVSRATNRKKGAKPM